MTSGGRQIWCLESATRQAWGFTECVCRAPLEVSCFSEVFLESSQVPKNLQDHWKWSSVPAPHPCHTMECWVLSIYLGPRGFSAWEASSFCHFGQRARWSHWPLWAPLLGVPILTLGPRSLALSDPTFPTARTCRSIWRVVPRMESLECIIRGAHWGGTAWPFPAISWEVSLEEPPLEGRTLSEFTGEGPVSGSSRQLVRARPGPSRISHVSAQLETREKQDSEVERWRQA